MRVVLTVDIQQGFEDHRYWGGPRNNPSFEHNVAQVMAAARASGVAVIHVKHDSTTPGSPLQPHTPGNALMTVCAPLEGEPVIAKSVNSGFIGTDLEQRLRASGATELFIFGLTTDHCVSTTVRMAGNLGFPTVLIGDACATFPKRAVSGGLIDAQVIHDAHLASLDGEFAQVLTTAQALRRLG